MRGRVVYTVLTGGYDILRQPAVTDPRYDYVCLTDRNGQDGVWRLVEIPFEGTDIDRARYAKLQPHAVLPEYGISVFMDANLRISSREFYDRVDEALARGDAFAALPHPDRDCVYDELRYCFLKDKLSTGAALRHHKRLTESGMPRHAGLFETNVLLRRHCAPEAVAVDDAWWRGYRECCTRDQLTLTPALYATGLLGRAPSLLFGPGLNARNVPYVSYSVHPPTGKERVPGRIDLPNARYRLRLWWRKFILLFLR